MILALVSVGSFAGAQTTNTEPSATDYPSFARFISERNIFDPDRYPRRSGNRQRNSRPSRTANAFKLVGTMSYNKGMYAFFDGSDSVYRKALQPDGKIAGYTVTEVTLKGVRIKSGDKVLEMKIGTQMWRENEASEWQLTGQRELPTSTVESDSPASTEVPATSSGGEVNDVLKRLMQKREQESK
jgi:hypothetical protein